MTGVRPNISTVKTLFALSRNVCAYDRCENVLTDPKWSEVAGQIAHIYGERPGSARYEPTMTDGDRASFWNLILLCPWCHTLIDRLDPRGHPPDLLIEMKAKHESRSEGLRPWASDAQLTVHAERLLRQILSVTLSTSEETATDGFQPLVTARMILEETSAMFGFSVEELESMKIRRRAVVMARQIGMYVARQLTDLSYPAIAREYGGRDHTTVIHAVEKVSALMTERRQIYDQVDELIKRVRGRASAAAR